MPKFSWRRYANADGKTGGIELTTETMPKNIYGWVMDNRSRFRRDFRIAGVRDNHKGEYMMPDYPNYPPGYPDKAPVGDKVSKKARQSLRNEPKKFEKVKESSTKFVVHNDDFLDCEEDKLVFEPDEWCKYLFER